MHGSDNTLRRVSLFRAACGGGRARLGSALLSRHMPAPALFNLLAQSCRDFSPCGGQRMIAGGCMDIGAGHRQGGDGLVGWGRLVLALEGQVSMRDGHEFIQNLKLRVYFAAQSGVGLGTQGVEFDLHGVHLVRIGNRIGFGVDQEAQGLIRDPLSLLLGVTVLALPGLRLPWWALGRDGTFSPGPVPGSRSSSRRTDWARIPWPEGPASTSRPRPGNIRSDLGAERSA